MDDIPLIPYSQRHERSSGQCRRCGAWDVHVIESVQGGWLCFYLGGCQMRRPFPRARYWDRSMGEIVQ